MITSKNKRRISDSTIQKYFLIFSVIVLIVFILFPLVSLLKNAFMDTSGNFIGISNFSKYVENPSLIASFKNSIFVSTVSSLISLCLAFIYSYAITRTNIKFKDFFKTMGMFPLFAPTMLYGISLIYLFGNKGIFTTMGLEVPLYGPLGIIISQILFTFPQAFLILSVALSMADYRLYEASDSLGASEFKKFCKITIPGIKYSLLSSFFVSFILAFTDFGAAKVVGGNYNVLATDIYKQVVGQFNIPMGATVSMVMLIPVLIAFTLDKMASKKQGMTITAKSMPYKIKENKFRDRVFLIVCSFITLLIFILIFVSVIGSVIKLWPYNLSFTMEHYTFKGILGSGIKTYLSSLKISTLTAIFGTIFVFFSAYMIEKVDKFPKLRQTAYLLSMIPMALPGLVLGISYITFFNSASNPLNFLYGSTAILVIVNVIHFYSVCFITSNSSLKMLDKEYELVAKSINIPFYKVFFNITVPMSITSILEIVVYYFVNSMVTVSALIFLYTPQTQTASISILKLDEIGYIGPSAAMAVLVLLTNIIVRLLYEFVTKKLKNNTQKWQQKDAA
ncbi:putative 2-aminoethylphosphonate ABC transporter permease subunit [Clostridioides difficile]|uniref:putative 2-aminoethylphosphonate ABC transporter permease subunit n=1 Tax=Clostridioides difficile TaxID=1496 RepID=UPI0009444BAD|nr:putative 2-aminoethylphosphonate ABC transporter permease subunit [Clostridioides difficile]KAK2242981.1 phosphonate ABC transporter permease [Clostridioides difficile]MBY2843643.1 putative 2-aminoethylphosphonate ABC transporter permease subunit [Clostridioides difficile]MDM9959149.1 putative 2-aminoethylphosphonate ABC transporter permease subunit [Clostridioides difficile]MDO0132240.1 putative 2-aminoethylphosphonate ABC transporter permease subunit [Clostridioides difficile]HBG2784508.1